MCSVNRFYSSFTHPITDVVLYSELTEDKKEFLLKILVGSSATEEIKKRGEILSPSSLLTKVSTLIKNYLNGKKVDFSNINLKIDNLSIFQQKILTTARKIPYGKLYSYSQLAQEAGFPFAIRAVATVMRLNPFPIIVPCHRVILKNGSYGSYCGKNTGKDAILKRKLIELEQQSFHI